MEPAVVTGSVNAICMDWRRLFSEAVSIVKPGVIIPIAIGTVFLGAAVVVGIQLFGGG